MPSVLKWMSKRHNNRPNDRLDPLFEQPAGAPGLIEEFDVPYVSEEGVPLAMDIYRPKGQPGPLPVIILVHGGGLMVGHPRMERSVCELLARKGFLVFVPGYRLITGADGIGELCDVTAGMNHAASLLPEYGGDPNRVYMIGESAGAWLSLYAAVMTRSEALRSLMDFSPADIRIRGMIFVSGMFYTLRKDVIGLVYPRDLYGSKRYDPVFMEYMNPECREIIRNLPPVILASSRDDYLRNYTLRYAKALDRAGHRYRLFYYPERNKELVHAFVTLKPELKESRECLDKICRML